MTLEQMNVLLKEQLELMQKTLKAKGDDYSDEDRLSNFKTVAAITHLKPEMVAIVLIAVKIARLATLYKKDSEPRNEPIIDSQNDLINYTFLLKCLSVESAKTTEDVTKQ